MASGTPDTIGPAPGSSSRRNWRRLLLLIVAAAALVAGGLWGYRQLDASELDYDVVITPQTIPADNSSSALLQIRIISRFGNELNVRVLPHAPTVRIVEGERLVTLIPMADSLSYRIRSGVETGRVVIHVQIFGAPGPIEATLELMPSLADRNHNGYPDAMDLTSESDRTAFRRWFTTIALGQLTHVDDRWNDRDCAGLLRYCFREALKKHDNAWLKNRQWLVTSAIPDVRKYNYPNVPLVGTRVFNAGDRVEQPSGEAGTVPARRASARAELEQFSDFAEAARLKDNSLVYLSRDPADALPGDVIFYLNDTESEWPYHTMIYTGDGRTVYHTGPDDGNPGIVKRLSLAQLSQHPNSRWHPVASNPYFLGFYRWRILS